MGRDVPFSARMGLCVPIGCDEEDLRPTFDPYLTRTAINANYTAESIVITYAPTNPQNLKLGNDQGTIWVLITVGILIILIIIGTIIHCTKLGNIKK